MILEGIVTTLDAAGRVNIAPMGPRIDERGWERFTLRPFATSQTYRNLRATGCGVLHVTDDVELLARAAIDRWDTPPPLEPARLVPGLALSNACRWCEFRVAEFDDAHERVACECETVHVERRRDFFGFNRAMHAVVEAAILATRVQLLAAGQIAAEFERLRPLVEKTAGPREQRAFALLEQYLAEQSRE